MMKKTHISLGLAFTLPLITSGTVAACGIIGLLGSIAPDWDLKLHIRHRTLTHCILLLATTTMLISKFNIDISAVWFVNYLLHLLSDSLTLKGVPFLYPFKRKYYGLKLFRTGGVLDFITFLIGLYLIFIQII